MLGTDRESGIGGMEGVAVFGAVGCVLRMFTLCEGSMECVGEAGDFEGERRLISACAGSEASEGGTSAFGASSVEGGWVGLEWSDVGRGDGLGGSTECVSLGSSLMLGVFLGGEEEGRALGLRCK